MTIAREDQPRRGADCDSVRGAIAGRYDIYHIYSEKFIEPGSIHQAFEYQGGQKCLTPSKTQHQAKLKSHIRGSRSVYVLGDCNVQIGVVGKGQTTAY